MPPPRGGGGINGRIYDPELGRFLSPDPFIHSPGNSQAWGAYTYVLNNPAEAHGPEWDAQ